MLQGQPGKTMCEQRTSALLSEVRIMCVISKPGVMAPVVGFAARLFKLQNDWGVAMGLFVFLGTELHMFWGKKRRC